jgi:predicted dehydrogenase
VEAINVALIGKGYWGSILEKYIRENPNFSIQCVCNSKSNLETEVWNNSEIRAVVIATPNQTHYPIVKAALLSGKHVLSEKPLALRTNECEELQYLANEKKLTLLTDYVYIFSKSLDKAQKIIKNREIGNLKSIEMTLKQLGRFGREDVYWLLGSHMLSVLDMFVPLGDLQFFRKDLVAYKGRIETGVIDFKKQDFAGQIMVSLNYPGKEKKIVIYGDKGTIVYNPISQPSLWIENYERIPWTITYKLPKKHRDYKFDESNNLRYVTEQFYKTIIGAVESNVRRTVSVTKILEKLDGKTV